MEVMGWIGSCFVLISFIPGNVKTIRIINAFGCIAWITYGLMNHAPSVFAMNLVVLIFHIFHLIKGK